MRTIFLALLLCLGFLPIESTKAQESQLSQYNCAVSLPVSPRWVTLSNPSSTIKAVAQTTDKTAAVSLSVVTHPDPTAKLDGKFIEQFEQGYFPAGKSKKTSGTPLVLQGVPAYRATGEIYAGGRTFQSTLYLWIADGKVYSLSAIKLNAAPMEDAEIRAAMSSFHFLSPPKA